MYSVCKQGKLILYENESARWGLYSQLYLKCNFVDCGVETLLHTSKLRGVPRSRSYEVNRRATFAMSEMGNQRADMAKFCSSMNMPPPPDEKSWHLHTNAIDKVTVEECEPSMARATATLRAKKGKMQNKVALMKQSAMMAPGQGHSTHYGVGITISTMMWFVIFVQPARGGRLLTTRVMSTLLGILIIN